MLASYDRGTLGTGFVLSGKGNQALLQSKRAAIALSIAGMILAGIATGAMRRLNQPLAAPPITAITATATDVPLQAAPPLLRLTPVPTVPPPTPTLARRAFSEQMDRKIAPTTFLPGRGPELPGSMVYSGRWLDFYVGSNTFTPDEVRELAVKSELALRYVQRRFAVRLSERVSAGVYNPVLAPDRSTRGIAHTAHDFIKIYYRPGEDMQSAVVIMSHELAHQLQAEAYGADAQKRADLVLLEGIATWISGEYWLNHVNAPSWQARSYQLLEQGYGANLRFAHHSGNFDAAYELWAGFVDYLAETYGWDKLNALYVTGRGRSPGSADYRGIYGKSFVELEMEWKRQVMGDG